MANFKEKNWELITFEDFLQDARDRLSCDDGADARGGIPWERIMAPTNGRHAAIILDCLVSANRFGQHEQEPQLAWRARGEGDPTSWAAYVAEKIRRGAETSNRISHDGDAQGGDKGWRQGGEGVVCGGAGEHGAAPGIAGDDLEAGIGGGPCDGGATECEAESVPEKYHEQVFVRPGPQPIGIIETGNDMHVYVYEEDSIEQPTSEFDTAIYSNGPHDAMGYDAAHFYPETHQCHQQFAYAGQAYYNQHFGAYQERYYHQMQFPSDGEWHGQEQYLQQQQQQQ